MLFFNPIWDHEVQRIGKQRCTPQGYALHGISDLIGYCAVLMLFIVPVELGRSVFVGTFHARSLWLLSVPFGFAILGSVLYRLSWALAYRRGFQYDLQTHEASWLENGQRHTCKAQDVV